MTLSEKVDQFVSKYNGQTKGYPTDNDFKGECLSIAKIYIKEVFGINPPPSGSNSAYGYWSNFPSPLGTVFEKVANTPTGVPKKGDIPIWNTNAGGGFGHIDIFISGDANGFTGFDQNWNGRQAHLQTHNYSNIVGWLTPKVSEPTPEPGEPDMELSEVLQRRGVKTLAELDAKITESVGPNNDWGDDKKDGGFLGSARRRIKELEATPAPTPPSTSFDAPVIEGWENNGLQVTKIVQGASGNGGGSGVTLQPTWNYQKKG